MPKAVENFVVFLLGGVIYSLIEVTFRGFTHWSMTLTGGLCLLIMFRRFTARPNEPLLVKSLFGAITITVLEFIAGCIVNLWLGWGVWDYSGMMFNLFGQICLPFSVLWFFLSVPAVLICNYLGRRFSEM